MILFPWINDRAQKTLFMCVVNGSWAMSIVLHILCKLQVWWFINFRNEGYWLPQKCLIGSILKPANLDKICVALTFGVIKGHLRDTWICVYMGPQYILIKGHMNLCIYMGRQYILAWEQGVLWAAAQVLSWRDGFPCLAPPCPASAYRLRLYSIHPPPSSYSAICVSRENFTCVLSMRTY